MISMTGFGYCELEKPEYYLSVELKSYNNRYLDLQINLPPFLSPLEPRVREYVASTVRRGRVEVYVRIRELEESISVHLDKQVAREYSSILNDLIRSTGINDELKLQHLLQMDGILKTSKSRDIDLFWLKIEPILEQAVLEFNKSRKNEGIATEADILKQLSLIENSLSGITEMSGELESYFGTTLREKFQEVVGDQIEESRVLTEIAALMVKYSINEEIVRMGQHLKSFRDISTSQDAVGKKLDFLAQEIHREINTIGSKSIKYDISENVVSMKDALENIREQLRNVE